MADLEKQEKLKKLASKSKDTEYKPILTQLHEEEEKAKLSFMGRRKNKAEQKALAKQKKKEEKIARLDKENNIIVEEYSELITPAEAVEREYTYPLDIVEGGMDDKLPEEVALPLPEINEEPIAVKFSVMEEYYEDDVAELENVENVIAEVPDTEVVAEVTLKEENDNFFKMESTDPNIVVMEAVSAEIIVHDEKMHADFAEPIAVYAEEPDEEYVVSVEPEPVHVEEVTDVNVLEEIPETDTENIEENISEAFICFEEAEVEESAPVEVIEAEPSDEVQVEATIFEETVTEELEHVSVSVKPEVDTETEVTMESEPEMQQERDITETVFFAEEPVAVYTEEPDEDIVETIQIMEKEEASIEVSEQVFESENASESDSFALVSEEVVVADTTEVEETYLEDQFETVSVEEPIIETIVETPVNVPETFILEEKRTEEAENMASEIEVIEEEYYEDEEEYVADEEDELFENATPAESLTFITESEQTEQEIIPVVVPEVVEMPVPSTELNEVRDEASNKIKPVKEPKFKREQAFVSPVSVKPKKKVAKEKKKDTPEGNKYRNKNTISTLIRYTLQFSCVAVFFCAVVRTTIVASGSMEPTLITGNVALYNKLAYKVTDVQRGDIIAFWSADEESLMAKRVIGVSGDIVEFHDGYVFINGMLADESLYLNEDEETNCAKSFTVPDDCVFVLGDNRSNSLDSRYYRNPYISLDDIEGKYMGSIPTPW